MQQAEVKPAAPTSRSRQILLRILGFVVLAVLIACFVSVLFGFSNRQTGPAGFARGMLHGALMPMALPNLLVGENIVLYAPENNGRPYKTGYSLGVNVCGAIFFSFFFWRIRRLRKSFQKTE